MKNNLLSEKLVYTGDTRTPDPPSSGALYAGRGARIHGRQPPADRTAILRKGDDLASGARAERDRNRAAGLRPVRYRLSGDAGYPQRRPPDQGRGARTLHARRGEILSRRGGDAGLPGAGRRLRAELHRERKSAFRRHPAGDPQQRAEIPVAAVGLPAQRTAQQHHGQLRHAHLQTGRRPRRPGNRTALDDRLPRHGRPDSGAAPPLPPTQTGRPCPCATSTRNCSTPTRRCFTRTCAPSSTT